MADGLNVATYPGETVDWDKIFRALQFVGQFERQQRESEAAAKRFSASESIREMIDKGVDPMDAIRRNAADLYYGDAYGLGTTLRAVQSPRDRAPMIRGSPGQGFYQINPDGTVTNVMEGTKEERQQMDVSDKEELSDINREMRETQRLIGKLNVNKAYWTPEERDSYGEATNNLAELKRNKTDLMQKYGGAPPSPGSLSGGLTPPPIGQGASPFKEGQRVRNKRDGKMYIIRNGIPVPME